MRNNQEEELGVQSEQSLKLPVEKVSKDVFYKELERARQVDNAFKLAIHIVNIRNEFTRLLAWLIDHYIVHRFHRALAVNNKLTELLEYAETATRRNILKNETFQRRFCLLIPLIWKLPQSDHVLEVPSHEKIMRRIHDLLVTADAIDMSQVVYKLFVNHMTYQTLVLINLFYNRIKHNDKKNATLVALYIIGSGVKDVSVDQIQGDMFNLLKPEQKGDVLWYLWRLLIDWCRLKQKMCVVPAEYDHMVYCASLCRACCRMSQMFYCKSYRDTRIILFIKVLGVCMATGKQDLAIPEYVWDEVDSTSTRLFDDYFTKVYPKKKHMTHYKVVSRPIEKLKLSGARLETESDCNMSKASTSVCDGNPRSKSLDYLKMFTYAMHDVRVSSDSDTSE